MNDSSRFVRYLFKKRPTSFATSCPSLIAHTTKDWPFLASPQQKIPLLSIIYSEFSDVFKLPFSFSSRLGIKDGSAPSNPIAK